MDTCTQKYTDTHRHRHTETHTRTQRHTHGHRDRDTHTDTQDTHIHTGSHSQKPRRVTAAFIRSRGFPKSSLKDKTFPVSPEEWGH